MRCSSTSPVVAPPFLRPAPFRSSCGSPNSGPSSLAPTPEGRTGRKTAPPYRLTLQGARAAAKNGASAANARCVPKDRCARQTQPQATESDLRASYFGVHERCCTRPAPIHKRLYAFPAMVEALLRILEFTTRRTENRGAVRPPGLGDLSSPTPPIMLYNGESPWAAATNIRELIALTGPAWCRWRT